MSHIGIHRVEDIARRHLARILQIEALPPQMKRGEFDFWDFSRVGAAHGHVPVRRARALLPQAEYMPSAGAELLLPAAPTGERCARRIPCFVYLESQVFDNTFFLASSTPPIPFRFTIGDISLNNLSNVGGGFLSWNAWAGSGSHNSDQLTTLPSGERVFLGGSSTAGLITELPSRVIGPVINGYYVDSHVPYRGGGPYAANQSVTFAVSTISGGPANLEVWGFVEIIECLEEMGGAGGPVYGEPSGWGPGPTPAPGAEPAPPPDWTEVF